MGSATPSPHGRVRMEYRVLGKLEVARDGEAVDLGAFRQRALLALMLTEPNAVWSTDRIIDQLWGDDAPAGRQNALWVHVSGLRKAIEPTRPARTDGTVLLTRAPGYLLALDPVDLDSLRFGSLVSEGRALVDSDPAAASLVLGEALALWRGAAYEEFAYEGFAQAEIRRLDELRLEAVEARIDADLASGRDRELVSELQALVRQHPFREGLTGQLMLALYRSGRQAEALRAFQILATGLGEELGIEPSTPLRRLHDQLVLGDPQLDVTARTVVASGPVSGLAIRGYELRDPIGDDSTGIAYRAYQPAVGREVTITVLRAELANDPAFARRFEADAQHVASLEHPNIVPLYDYWREPGGAFLVTPLLGGGSLAGMLDGGPLDHAFVARMAEQVGGALDAAHQRGIVHRHLTPSNILVDEQGNAYLSNFAIAIDEDVEVPTEDRSVAAYLAPELLAGEGATAATDVYALGAVVAHALSGSALDLGDSIGTLPPPTAAVVGTATATDVARRYPRAGAFAADLAASFGHSAIHLDGDPSIARNPYKGLRSFAGPDASDFFGRERLVDRLVAQLGSTSRHGRFLAVVGPSGSGKSSVVRAGLLPALRRGALAGSSRWYIVEMTPGQHPFESLEEALERIAAEPVPDLLERLVADVGGLRRVVESVLPPDGSQLVVVVDQFEELFTLAPATAAQRFMDAIADAIGTDRCRMRVVVTLRADFLDRPLAHTGFGELLHHGMQLVTPMASHEIEQAITSPVRPLGVAFEPALVAELISDAAERPGALPLLQYALTELYERRQNGRIAITAYREMKGLSGALVQRADGLFAELDAAGRSAARQIFLRLVSIGDGEEWTRRRVLRSELEDLGLGRHDVDTVLETFGRHRLLSFDRDPITRGPTVEISHESLLGEWQRLNRWIADAREDVRNQRRLAESMYEWEQSGRRPDYLLRGGRLEQLHGWARTTTLRLSVPESEFLTASVEDRNRAVADERDRERRTARRLRRLLIAAVCLLTLVVGAGVVAVAQRSQAASARRSAEITTLANRSLALRSQEREVAALLAVEADHLRPDSASESALFATFSRDPGFLGYHEYDGARIEGVVIPGTNTAVVTIASADPVVSASPLHIVDLTTGALGSPFERIGNGDDIFAVAASRDGATVAVGSLQKPDDGGAVTTAELVTFDAASGRITQRIPADVGRRYSIALDADGSHVALSRPDDGTVTIYDVGSGDTVATIPPGTADTEFGGAAAGWSPDGRLVVGSSDARLREFEPATFRLTREIAVPDGAAGRLLRFSDDGSYLVTQGPSGAMARIDLPSGKADWSVPPDPSGELSCDAFALSPTEERLWCADATGVIRSRSLLTGGADGGQLEHQRGWLSGFDVVEVGAHHYLVTLGRQSASIGRWELDGGGAITRDLLPGAADAIYSPDGQFLLAIEPGDDGISVAVFDGVGDQLVVRIPVLLYDFAWLDLSHLAVVTTTNEVFVVDLRTGHTTDAGIRVGPDWRNFVNVGDHRIALGYGDGHVDLFDLDDGRRTSFVVENPDYNRNGTPGEPLPVGQLVGSPDGSEVYAVAFGVYVHDATDGRQLRRLSDTSVNTIALVDGGPLAIGHVSGAITLHDPVSFEEIAALPGARAMPRLLDFSSDGRRLVSLALDDTMSLYDLPSRRLLGDPVAVVADSADLRPDGLALTTARRDGSGVLEWDLDPASWSKAACSVAGRSLTRSEWSTYIGNLEPFRQVCPA